VSQQPSEPFDEVVELGGPEAPGQVQRVPARRGVLAMLAADGRPILLLTAADMRSRLLGRLRGHEQDQPRTRMPDLKAVTARVGWRLASSAFQADLCFLELARRFWPDDYPRLLAWKGPRMVHADLEQAFGRLVRTDSLEAPGVYLGPFEIAASADRFVEVLIDAFDLCRNHRILTRAPRGEPCVYGELGRCLRACDGTVPMDQYRQALAQAVAYAAGPREAARARLQQRMKQSAGELQFERAAALKQRLDRLAELEAPFFGHVGTLERFRYILIPPTPRKTRAKSFLAASHVCVMGPEMAYPLVEAQLAELLQRMGQLDRQAVSAPPDRWLMGLVSHYLYSSPARSGLILRWQEGMTGADLGQRIEARAPHLGLGKAPKAS
jgi:hypothetical protein